MAGRAGRTVAGRAERISADRTDGAAAGIAGRAGDTVTGRASGRGAVAASGRCRPCWEGATIVRLTAVRWADCPAWAGTRSARRGADRSTPAERALATRPSTATASEPAAARDRRARLTAATADRPGRLGATRELHRAHAMASRRRSGVALGGVETAALRARSCGAGASVSRVDVPASATAAAATSAGAPSGMGAASRSAKARDDSRAGGAFGCSLVAGPRVELEPSRLTTPSMLKR